MIGVASTAPNCPGLVIVNVPPWTSSGSNLPSLARTAHRGHRLAARRPREPLDPLRRGAGRCNRGCLAPSLARSRRLRLVGSIGGLDMQEGLRPSIRSTLPRLDVCENVLLADPAAD